MSKSRRTIFIVFMSLSRTLAGLFSRKLNEAITCSVMKLFMLLSYQAITYQVLTLIASNKNALKILVLFSIEVVGSF